MWRDVQKTFPMHDLSSRSTPPTFPSPPPPPPLSLCSVESTLVHGAPPDTLVLTLAGSRNLCCRPWSERCPRCMSESVHLTGLRGIDGYGMFRWFLS